MKKELQNKDNGLGFLRHWKVMTMTLLLLTFSIGNVWADTTLLSEDFSNCNGTGGTTGTYNVSYSDLTQITSGNKSTYLSADIASVDYSNSYVANGCMLNKGSSKVVTLKTVSSTSFTGGKATLSVRVAGWSGNSSASQLKVKTDNATITEVGGSQSKKNSDLTSGTAPAKGEWTTYTFNITNVTANLTITIKTNYVFIDDIILTTAASGPVDPTITFNNSNYTIEGSDLDLSSLFTSNSTGAVTYSIKNANGTGAALRADGKSFYATTAGTATVTASQAAVTSTYNAKAVDATITVLAPASAAPTISAHPSTADVLYIKDAAATALSVTASGSGTVTYQWYSNTTASNTDGTILENCTTATCTPSTAATGKLYYYCEVTNTETSKSPTTIKSNVSGLVRVVAAPTHLVENVMATSGSWDSYIVSANSHISNLKTIAASEGKTLIKSGKETASSPRTPGITSNSSATLVESDYIYIQFTIEEGYELAVSAVSVPVFSISNEGKYVARLSDNAGTPHVIQTAELAVAASADGTLFSGYDFSSSPTLTGTVTLKLFAYGWDKGYRMKSPVYIDGEVKAVGACTTPTIAWDGDQPENAYVSDGSKTFKVTSNYTDGINLELSSNTCGATFAAKSGSDNKQWVVSFTGAGSVTITPKVVGDGSTVCAETVSAAAKTLTVTLAHDVTFNMNGHGAAIAKQVVADGGKATAPYVADVADWVFGGWFTDAECTVGNEFDFANTTITADRPLYAKWTADACASERKSLSKVVLTSASEGTVSGHNGEEYAGAAVIAGLNGTQAADLGGGSVTGYKLSSGGSAIVFATLKKGSFQAGDKVVIGITKKQDTRELNGTKNLISIYYGTNASDAALLTTIYDVSAAGYYTYRLTEADVTAIGEKKGIGVFRESSNGQNPHVYSVEITGCRTFAVSHDVTFDMKSHGTQVAKQTIEVGTKVTEPEEPEAEGWLFGGWYKENTLTNKWNFSTDVMPDNDITLYAKWTEDPCTDRQSLSKVVLTAKDNGTVTGYNSKEYAGEAIIASLDKSEDADIIGDETKERGYKLNSGGNSIVMATLKKGNFQEGDKVIVGITKVNDQRTIDASTAIMTIYAGSDKDHMMEVATIKNVNAAGFYTYRLTAANATAINEAGYKSIGLFRASSNGQNHYAYSVEITGCRDWAELHSVSYNLMGHGTPIAPQVVAKGDKVTKPTNPVETDWAFCGWYKEEGLVNEWNFASDVMGSSDISLYAKWESEAGAIKLFDGEGNLNTTNFISPTKTTIEISSATYPCLAEFSSNRTSLGGATPADMVQYNATTDKAKIKMTFYNNNSGVKKAILYKLEEGSDTPEKIEIEVPGQEIYTTDYYEFNSSKNRSFYVCMNDRSNIRILQVTVMDNGTTIQKAGQAGYSVTFNKGRMYVKNDVATSFEGMTINASSEYKVFNNSNLATNSYISFTNAVANTIFKVTRSSSNAYYITNDLDNKGTSYTTDKEVTLTTAGTWYIGAVSGGSAASFTKFEFLAPKCEAPAFNALANSDICSGDPYVALDGTGTVTDGGTITYKWYAEGGTDVLGTDATYMPTADGSYFVVALHHVDGYTDNEATSDVVTVTTYASAAITTAPLNQRATVGNNVTLSVAATGKNVAYKWYTCDEDGTNEVALDPEQTGTSIEVAITAGLLQWYKVKVTSDCGNAEAMAKVEEFVPATPANVTESIVWDWESSAWPASGQVAFTAQVEDGTDLTPAYEFLADADAIVPNNAAFRSDMLYGKGQWVWRAGNKFFQGTAIKFTTEVAGLVRVNYRSTGNNKEVQVTIAGTPAGKNKTSNFKWSEYVEVPAGAVEILCLATDENKSLTRVQKIEFLALENRRTAGWIKPGELGTVCLENTSIVEGATIYELQGPDQYGKLVFDEVLSGEVVAGTPYLFEATATGQISFYKKVNAAHAGEAGELNGMHGTFSGETFSPSDGNAANLYYFSGNAIWCVANRSTDANIPAHGCYLNMEEFRELPIPSPTPAPGRRRITLGVNGKNTPTGLENGELINGENGVQKVLINGELFILRGEKMYDATGRLVK